MFASKPIVWLFVFLTVVSGIFIFQPTGLDRVLGRLQAQYDLKYGVPKWFQYGLLYQDSINALKAKMTPLGLEVVLRGCIIEGSEYERDMSYNREIRSNININLSSSSNTK